MAAQALHHDKLLGFRAEGENPGEVVNFNQSLR